MSGPLYVAALTLPPQHRHRMVVLEPLNKLLQAKWDLLIPRFFFNFLCYLMYMFLFTAVAYHQPALEKVQQVGGGGGEGMGRMLGEGGLLGPASEEDRAGIANPHLHLITL